VRITARVHPRASRARAILQPQGHIDVWVTAPAVDGRANAAVIALLATQLGLRERDVTLVRGERTRQKLLDVPIEPSTLAERLRDA
jgi:uncharacterized protein (TIGR00251 family)